MKYYSWDNFRERLMEHTVDVARQPHRVTVEQIMRSWAGSVVQAHWKAEELMEHLIAARDINNKQEEVTEKLSKLHKILEKVHAKVKSKLQG